MGLAFDEWDLDYYTNLFRDDMKRDPTNVELFDIAQSNSEHSRYAQRRSPHLSNFLALIILISINSTNSSF